MDFLKSAVASAIAKSPLAAYTVGDRVELEESIWTLSNATKRVSHQHNFLPGKFADTIPVG